MTIELLAFEQVQLLDVAGPLQVFASANQLAAAEGRAPPYAPRVVAASGPAVTASAGLGLLAAPLPNADAAVDTLLVAGGPGVHEAAADPALVGYGIHTSHFRAGLSDVSRPEIGLVTVRISAHKTRVILVSTRNVSHNALFLRQITRCVNTVALVGWVRQRAGRARRVASVCTGAFLLGVAGLLDGRRAATHWRWCAELARRFPAARVEADPIFVRDGPVWSSAGVTAGIDLALALVEQDLGRGVALDVARHLVVFLKRPGGQAQFSAVLSLQGAEDRFGALHRWVGEHLHGDLSLAALAAQAGMSGRSFSRRYAEATGLTPARAVERLRVEAARRLLVDTRLPVKRIAARCGFGSEETLRRSFLRLLAIMPQDYRDRFATHAR